MKIMKKRRLFLCLILTAWCLTGCQKTPDQQIVREKGKDSIAQYEQDTEQKNGEDTAEEPVNQETDENELRKNLGVPERYESTITSADGNFEVVCSAQVDVPDVSSVNVYQVSQKPFDQTLVDTFTETFVGADGVYDIDRYEQFGEKELVIPKVPTEMENQRFMGVFERDGQKFLLFLKTELAMPIVMEVQQIDENGPAGYGRHPYMWTNVNETRELPENTTKEMIEEMAGITADEAKKMADEKVAALGLEDMKAREQSLNVRLDNGSDETEETTSLDSGWKICYTREINGFPVTYDDDMGGGYASMDDDVTVPWSYENLEIVVNKDGVQQVHCYNLYDVGECTVENVKLKPFSEIAAIFEEMIQIQNANMRDDGYIKKKLQIEKVTLGYARIYDPLSGDGQGLLVPVWDFYGREQNTTVWENETYEYETGLEYYSKMTINAIDGTIIKRSLGY